MFTHPCVFSVIITKYTADLVILKIFGKYQQFISPMRAKQNKTEEIDFKCGAAENHTQICIHIDKFLIRHY